MSIDTIYRTTDLLSPCRFSENERQQFYSSALQQQYFPNQDMQIALPTKGILDLSQSYFDMDIVPLVNGVLAIVPEVQTSFDIHQLAGAPASAGSFFIEFNGDSSYPIPFNATAAQVQLLLEGMIQISGRDYLVYCTGGPLPGADITVNIGNFDSFNVTPEDNGYFTINSNDLNAAGVPILYVIPTASYTAGVLSSPRMERYTPIFNRIYVQVDSDTPYDCLNFNVLQAIEQLTEVEFARDMRVWTGSASENGQGWGVYPNNDLTQTQVAQARRFQLSTGYIPLFRKLLPMSVLQNIQIRIFMRLENPVTCLVIGDATNVNNNPTNQSYSVLNPRIQYHTLTVTNDEYNILQNAYNSDKGIVLDFRSWSNYNEVIQANTGGQINTIFNPSSKSFLGMYFTMYSIPYAGLASNVRKITCFLKENIESYKLKIDNRYYPADQIQSSNIYPFYTQMIQELRRFISLVQYKVCTGDAECFINYTQFSGQDPSQVAFDIAFGEQIHQSTIMAITTADIGYDVENRLCDQVALMGADTSGSPSVQLEMFGLSPLQSAQLNIHYCHQDFLIFRNTVNPDGTLRAGSKQVTWVR